MLRTESRVEYAVQGDGGARVATAFHHAEVFYQSELAKIRARTDNLLNDRAAGRVTQAECDRQAGDIRRAEAALQQSWENSSVRRAALGLEQEHRAAGREERIAPAAVMPPGAQQLRQQNVGAARGHFVGLAAVTGVWANIGGFFEESVEPGAFAGVLRDDVTLNYQHSDELGVLARTPNSLSLSEDVRGLRIRAEAFPRDPQTAAVRRRILRGDLSKMSFAFTVAEDTWEFARRPGELDRRRILRFSRLFDVSIVSRPAYPTTTIGFVDAPQRSAVPPITADDYFADADEEILAQDRRRPAASAAEVARLRREIILLRHYAKSPS